MRWRHPGASSANGAGSRSLARVRRFHQFKHAASSQSRQEKVIARVEATAMGTDARFIVTNLDGRAKHLHEKVYCQRGTAGNLI